MPADDPAAAGPSAPLPGNSSGPPPIELRTGLFRRGAILLIGLTLFGFVGWWYLLRPIQRNVNLRVSLAKFGLMYRRFQRENGRSPRDFDEFEAFLSVHAAGKFATETDLARPALEMARAGSLRVIWSAEPFLAGNSREFLAVEPKIGTDGGFILWKDMGVAWMSAGEYNLRPPIPIRTWP